MARSRSPRKRGARGARRAPVVCGDPNDPHGLYVWMQRYLSWLRVRNYSPATIKQRVFYLSLFVTWADGRGLARPGEVTKPILESYQRHMYHLRVKHSGKPLTFRSQHSRLVPVRSWFKWLTRQNVIGSNPASELVLPKLERRLPVVMTDKEVELVLAGADTSEPLGVRDRTIMEVLYSTGIRRMEVVGLSVWDIDADAGTLMVRQGKGRRDRLVPIGERALAWAARYLDSVRPQLVAGPDEGAFFIGQMGGRLSKDYLTWLVSKYVAASGINKRGSCHLFRHTVATTMLEHGADIRYIQQMLGHMELTTTQLYTQVSIKKLKEVHSETHPTAKWQGAAEGDGSGDGGNDDGDGSNGDAAAGDNGDAGEALAELMGDLAGEGDDAGADG